MYTSKLTLACATLLASALSLSAEEAVRRLTQVEAMKSAVSKPQPEYPSIASQLRIQGIVEVEISISAAGTVEEAKVLSGNPALTNAALNAVKRWRFEPVLSDGKPVRARAVISFSFKTKGS